MSKEIEFKYNVIKSSLRDIKTSIILGNYDIKIDPFTDRGGGLFRRKKGKMIQSLIDLGAVLTGSTALGLYKVNGMYLTSRVSNDFDFVVTKDDFIKFCGIWDLHNVKSGSDNVVTININTGKYRGTDSYGYDNGYWFGCNFDVIGTDDEIHWTENYDVKVMNLDSIIGYKYNLMSDFLHSTGFEKGNKHLDDLWTIVTRLSNNGI